MLTGCTTGAFARPSQRQVVHYAGQMLIDGNSVASRSRSPLREGADFCHYQAGFWHTSQCISMGQSSRGRSNTSEDIEHQTAIGGEALGRQLEYRAQLVQRPKVGGELRESTPPPRPGDPAAPTPGVFRPARQPISRSGFVAASGGAARVDSNSTLQERCERVTGFEPV